MFQVPIHLFPMNASLNDTYKGSTQKIFGKINEYRNKTSKEKKKSLSARNLIVQISIYDFGGSRQHSGSEVFRFYILSLRPNLKLYPLVTTVLSIIATGGHTI